MTDAQHASIMFMMSAGLAFVSDLFRAVAFAWVAMYIYSLFTEVKG